MVTPYRYTGQRWEEAIGLYFYQARWVDPALGRFLQPDTLVPEPGNPQALNRYSYCLNDPVKYNDPSGHTADQGGASAFDPDWVRQFQDIYGRMPTSLDWLAYLLQQRYPGSGHNGWYTADELAAVHQISASLGEELIRQIGKDRFLLPDVCGYALRIGSAEFEAISSLVGMLALHFALPNLPMDAGGKRFNVHDFAARSKVFADGVEYFEIMSLGPIVQGITYGGFVVGIPGTADDRGFLSHEYVHVLQWRAMGTWGFAKEYVQGGFANWDSNPLEVAPTANDSLYRDHRNLPPTWAFCISCGVE